MYYLCSVDGCKSVRQDVYIHCFPVTNEKRLKKWLQCLSGKFSLSLNDLKNCFVCLRHFERRFITSSDRLRAIAYPTLFTEEEITTGIPSLFHLQYTENLIPHEEHNYSRKQQIDHNYCKLSTSVVLQEVCLNEQEQIPVTSTAVLEELNVLILPLHEPMPSTSSSRLEQVPVVSSAAFKYKQSGKFIACCIQGSSYISHPSITPPHEKHTVLSLIPLPL